MIATAVRVAAIENIALDPDRKSEIVDRVANLRTREEAIAFLNEVQAKMDAVRPH
jgi:hypothetical protein